MSKPTLAKMNLQYFAEETEETVEETVEDVAVEEVVEEEVDSIDTNEIRSAMGLKPKEVEKVTDKKVTDKKVVADAVPIEEEPNDDDSTEYDEITYNKETIKIPVSERKALLQKGYNYDKQHSKLSDYETKIKEYEELIGMDFDAALERTKANKVKLEIDEYANANNVSKADAKEMIEKDRKIKALEFKDKIRDHKDAAIAKKKELADELYFKELEPDIDILIQENIDKGKLIDVDTAYKYLLGTKAKELIESSKKKTEKRTLANVQDRAKRTVQKEAGAETQTVVLSDTVKEMAREMGVSPKKLAKRLAKKGVK